MRIRETRKVCDEADIPLVMKQTSLWWWSRHPFGNEVHIPLVMKHTFSRPRSSRLCALQTPRFCLNIQFFIYVRKKRGAKDKEGHCNVLSFFSREHVVLHIWWAFGASSPWAQSDNKKKKDTYIQIRDESYKRANTDRYETRATKKCICLTAVLYVCETTGPRQGTTENFLLFSRAKRILCSSKYCRINAKSNKCKYTSCVHEVQIHPEYVSFHKYTYGLFFESRVKQMQIHITCAFFVCAC